MKPKYRGCDSIQLEPPEDDAGREQEKEWAEEEKADQRTDAEIERRNRGR